MEEPKVFQWVGTDEMVISIAEYEEMKKQIETNREKQDYEYKIRQDIRNENFERSPKYWYHFIIQVRNVSITCC